MNVQRVVLVSTLYFFYVALADCLHSVICISGTDIFHVLCEDSGCASGCEDCIYVGTFFGHLQDCVDLREEISLEEFAFSAVGCSYTFCVYRSRRAVDGDLDFIAYESFFVDFCAMDDGDLGAVAIMGAEFFCAAF